MEVIRQPSLADKIKHVAVYLRKSRGTGDIEEDLTKHKLKIKEICEEFGWIYLFYEEIVSGSDIENRPEIQKLLIDVEKTMFDAVFVFDIDRLSRGGSADQELIFSTMRDTNTLLITANPFKIYNMNDESDDTLMDVFGFVSKMEYKQIRKRMVAGKKIGLKMGRWVNGNVPYGYSYNSKLKKLEVDKEKSAIVREMVDKYLIGVSTTDIAWDLNRRKIPSPRGGSWTSATITRIFKSLVYQGHIVGNKYKAFKGKENNKVIRQFKLLPESEWVIVRNCHKAIISEDEYNQIIERLGSLTKKRYKNKVNTFTGLIKCGKCGKTMHGKPFGGKSGIGKCSCGNMGGLTNLIESAVYETAIRLKKELNSIKVDEIEMQKENKLSVQIDTLTKQLDKQDFAIEQIEAAFESGFYDINKTRRKTEERQQEKWRLEKEISRLRKQLTAIDKHDNKERISKIDQFIEDIKKDINSEQKNQLYKSILSEIIWYKNNPNKVDITINFL